PPSAQELPPTSLGFRTLHRASRHLASTPAGRSALPTALQLNPAILDVCSNLLLRNVEGFCNVLVVHFVEVQHFQAETLAVREAFKKAADLERLLRLNNGVESIDCHRRIGRSDRPSFSQLIDS